MREEEHDTKFDDYEPVLETDQSGEKLAKNRANFEGYESGN